jgi:hypothetical protein
MILLPKQALISCTFNSPVIALLRIHFTVTGKITTDFGFQLPYFFDFPSTRGAAVLAAASKVAQSDALLGESSFLWLLETHLYSAVAVCSTLGLLCFA